VTFLWPSLVVSIFERLDTSYDIRMPTAVNTRYPRHASHVESSPVLLRYTTLQPPHCICCVKERAPKDSPAHVHGLDLETRGGRSANWITDPCTPARSRPRQTCAMHLTSGASSNSPHSQAASQSVLTNQLKTALHCLQRHLLQRHHGHYTRFEPKTKQSVLLTGDPSGDVPLTVTPPQTCTATSSPMSAHCIQQQDRPHSIIMCTADSTAPAAKPCSKTDRTAQRTTMLPTSKAAHTTAPLPAQRLSVLPLGRLPLNKCLGILVCIVLQKQSSTYTQQTR
jgi:hypothetical protein